MQISNTSHEMPGLVGYLYLIVGSLAQFLSVQHQDQPPPPAQYFTIKENVWTGNEYT